MQAREIMTSGQIWACHDSSSCREVAELMRDHDIGSLPVLDERDRLEGIVTDRDICCRLVAAGKSLDTPVGEIMTGAPECVHPDADLQEVEQLMRMRQVRRIPVVDEDMHVQGFIATADLARKLGEHDIAEVIETISQP